MEKGQTTRRTRRSWEVGRCNGEIEYAWLFSIFSRAPSISPTDHRHQPGVRSFVRSGETSEQQSVGGNGQAALQIEQQKMVQKTRKRRRITAISSEKRAPEKTAKEEFASSVRTTAAAAAATRSIDKDRSFVAHRTRHTHNLIAQ
ncbi:hypothetical protein QR680_003045 [Steinernema hermaphroditum]|uniref:Uncharacterized protein n=1 Tax=Steinernema hermaphroditum TaxID=289476 RepID=A0AA39H738_9BILA|nr:hypothetical protein QR680_003045 [Steinernema hermaphroditum]